ncbi:MAG: ATP-binding protein, partial [Actinomycetes bacterium]
LALSVAVALVGGLWPAVVGAVLASLLVNYFFTPPTGTLTIAELDNALALGIFVVIAVAVALVVDFAARRSADAARASGEAQALSTLAGDVVRSNTGTGALLARLQESFGQDAVSLVEREDARAPWTVVDHAGSQSPPLTPEDADTTVPIDDRRALLMRGRTLASGDRRVLDAFAAHTVALLDRDRLREKAQEAGRLAEVDALRTAILAAVSHDVRTPLAGIKAGVSSLRQSDVSWTPDEREELLAAIENSTDRLDALLTNLLDLSRLQTGAVQPRRDEVALADIVARAAHSLPPESVTIEIADDTPDAIADGGLLERVVANVLENAVRHSPTGVPVRVSACAVDGAVQLQVSDAGPGVLDRDKDRMFKAFQRLGDAPAGEGIGLGLAVARGFAEALGGHLHAEDTPGGGLTMVLTLPAAVRVPSAEAHPPAVDVTRER